LKEAIEEKAACRRRNAAAAEEEEEETNGRDAHLTGGQDGRATLDRDTRSFMPF